MDVTLDETSANLLRKMMDYGSFSDPAEVISKALKLFYRKHARTENSAGDPTKNPAYLRLEDLPGEVWKSPPLLPDYEVSTLGRVRSLRFGKIRMLALTPFTGNYKRVTLAQDGQTVRPLVHTLVADAFLPKIDGKPDVNHRDGNKSNNALCNLERLSRSENIAHSVSSGLHAFGENHGKSKLSDRQVAEILEAKRNGESSLELAVRFNVSLGHIQNLVRGTYRSIRS